jgi:hypothetical protein
MFPFFGRHQNHVIDDDAPHEGRGPRKRKARSASRCENDLPLLNHIWGADRISDNQKFHPVSKEFFKGEDPFEFPSEYIGFRYYSLLFLPPWKH